jgi:hypothetical protein
MCVPEHTATLIQRTRRCHGWKLTIGRNVKKEVSCQQPESKLALRLFSLSVSTRDNGSFLPCHPVRPGCGRGEPLYPAFTLVTTTLIPIYIYIDRYIDACIYTHAHTHVYTCTCIHIYTHAHVYNYFYIYIYIYIYKQYIYSVI